MAAIACHPVGARDVDQTCRRAGAALHRGLQLAPRQRRIGRLWKQLDEHAREFGHGAVEIVAVRPQPRSADRAPSDRAPRRCSWRRRRDGCPRRRARRAIRRGAAANPSRSAIPMRRHARRAASTLGKQAGPARLRFLRSTRSPQDWRWHAPCRRAERAAIRSVERPQCAAPQAPRQSRWRESWPNFSPPDARRSQRHRDEFVGRALAKPALPLASPPEA